MLDGERAMLVSMLTVPIYICRLKICSQDFKVCPFEGTCSEIAIQYEFPQEQFPEELSNVVRFVLHVGKNVKMQSRSLSYIHIYSATYIQKTATIAFEQSPLARYGGPVLSSVNQTDYFSFHFSMLYLLHVNILS